VVAKGAEVNADIAAAKVGNLLKGTGGVAVDIERIRQEVPSDVASFEVIEYRICTQYGNGILTREEYRSFIDRILPAIRKQVSQPVEAGEAPYRVRILNQINRLPDINFAVSHKINGEEILSIVTFVLYVEVINMQMVSSIIARLSVDGGMTPEGPWKRLMPIPTRGRHIYVVLDPHDLKMAREISFKHDGLGDLIRNNQSFKPRVPISGYLLFAKSDIQLDTLEFFRFRIEDAVGTKATAVVKGSIDSSSAGEILSQQFEQSSLLSFEVINPIVDISGFKKKDFPLYPN
jgi:hypothetical protein